MILECSSESLSAWPDHPSLLSLSEPLCTTVAGAGESESSSRTAPICTMSWRGYDTRLGGIGRERGEREIAEERHRCEGTGAGERGLRRLIYLFSLFLELSIESEDGFPDRERRGEEQGEAGHRREVPGTSAEE